MSRIQELPVWYEPKRARHLPRRYVSRLCAFLLVMDQIQKPEEAKGSLESESSSARPGRMRRDPLRLAWVVTLASFAAFCVLLLLAISGSVFAYRNYQVQGKLLLQPALGTVYVNNQGSTDTIAVTQVLKNLEEGSSFTTPGITVPGGGQAACFSAAWA